LEANKLEKKNPSRVHEINKSPPKLSVAKKSPTPGFEGILDTMFALFNAPFHSDQLRVRILNHKNFTKKSSAKQISLHPRRSTYPQNHQTITTKKIRQFFSNPPKETIHQLFLGDFLMGISFEIRVSKHWLLGLYRG